MSGFFDVDGFESKRLLFDGALLAVNLQPGTRKKQNLALANIILERLN